MKKLYKNSIINISLINRVIVPKRIQTQMLHIDFVPCSTKTTKKFTVIIISFLLLILPELFALAAYGQSENEYGNFSLDYSFLRYIDYNRVDGTFPGLQTILTNDLLPRSSLTTRIGYGIKSNEWRYAISINHSFDLLNTKSISLTFFDETRSNDRVILSQPENILSTMLLRKDYRDYFRQRGFETQLNFKFTQNFSTIFNFSAGKYNSLSNLEPWSLFSVENFFRFNPNVEEGGELLLSAAFRFDSRDEYFIESNYWNVELKLEHEFKDFNFDGIHFLVERMHLGWGSQTLIAGLQGGFRNGTTAEQYLMDLGGIGTLRGYDFKNFTGTKMLIFKGNYLFNGDLLGKIPLQFVPLYSSMAAGVFFDAGLTWFGKDKRRSFSQGPLPLQGIETGSGINDIKSNIGVSLLLLDGLGKIDIARRLDRSKDAWKITFRFRLFQYQ